MEKEKNSAGGAKVLEPKKEKRRRLVLSSDSETEGFVISARGKADEAAGGSRNVAEEKGGVGEKAEARQEFLERRLGTKGGKENLSEMRPDSKSREAGDAHVIRKKIKSYSLGSDGYLSEKTGAVKVSELGSDRKNMAIWDAGARIKKAKLEHMGNQLEKKTEGNGKKLESLKHRSSIMKGFTDGIQGLNVPASASKQTDMDSPVERKLHFNPNKCCKTETEHSRWLERLGERGHQKLMDHRVPGVGSKKEEKDGSSQHGYIRMQGKNGVLKVLQKNKVHAPGNAIDRGQVEGYTRRLKSSNTEKMSKSNEVERRGAENSRSAGKVSADGRSDVHGAKSKPEKLSGNSSDVHLLHGKTSAKAKKRERVSGFRSPPLVKTGTKESRASRNEVKKKLREQIKNILLDAGWKIELRPRKGRDYEDAVYVSPQGTGYWSITKAYDVYREQLNSDSDGNKGPAIQSKPSVGADRNHEGPSSTFAEIDPEALSLLKRNVVNKRKRKKEAVKLKRKAGGRRSRKSMETTKVKCSRDEETSVDVGGTRVIKKQSNNLLLDGSSIKKMHLIVRNKKGTGCVLLVRGSKQGKETEKSDYSPYVWKRTVLSWMIDMGVLPAYGKVRYMNKSKNRTLLEGRITRDGIHCSCCSKILTVSKFEIHAGSKMHQPYENALVEVSGVSLLQCQINAWEKQEQHKRSGFYEIDIDGDDQNDDTCSICGDGGDLICCDGCPSTFHLSCLGIQVLPPGDWHCANCSCKFCGVLHNSASPCKGATTPLLTCSQCEQKYHEECVPEGDAVFNAPNNQFCGRGCRKVFRQLHKLIGVKNELEAGYSWSIIRRFSDPSQSPSRFAQRVESNSKIAVAHAVMDECFLPIIDHRSGINLIDNVVYNCRSNFNRLNFSGFYTFILERNDEIISVASVRIHGTRLAEMPFIGTRSMYRRQGMCRRLLEGIEYALCSFSTEILIIPAISELTDTWTTVFGFRPLEISQKEEIKCVNMWVFPGTGLLHKQLLKKDLTVQNMLPQEAAKRKSKLIHHEVIGGSIPEAQRPIEADPTGSAAEIICTQQSAKHEEGTEDNTKGSAVKVICIKELKPEEEGAEHKIPALPPPDFDLLPDASQVFIASMAKDNLAERDLIADPQTQLQLFDDDLNSSNPHIDSGAKFVTKTVESHADAGDEAIAPVPNKVKSGNAADALEINASETNAEVSVGMENLNASSGEGSKVSSVAKQNGFEACVSGIGAMAEIHDKQDSTIILDVPAAEHCHCDDKCVLEISHDRNSFPCSSEQNACDPIDHRTQHQNSESPDKSSHADHESCNYSSPPAVITNEKPQIDAVSLFVLEPDDNLLHAMANKLVPQGSFTVSGSVKSLHGGSATGFVSINSTTEVSTNKIMISKAGVNQPVVLATCEVGDDICTEIDNYHEGACDVRIAEEDLDVVESLQAFDLSSVNHTSKVIT